MESMKIVKTELYDVNAMAGLLNHDGVSSDVKRLLRSYKKMSENGNEVQVIYEHGKGLDCGRIYPQRMKGLQAFPSNIRSALAQKYYWDVDMVNSQPVILLAKCKEYGWSCTQLEDYVMNRASKLEELMDELECSRADAKQFCLSILFGSIPYKKVPDYFTALAQEISNISNNCWDKFPKYAKLGLKKPNPKASCLAHWIQNEEAQIMEFLDSWLASKGRYLGVNIHDGGLVKRLQGETVLPVTLLRDAEIAVREQFGFDIGLSVKPLTHSFVWDSNRLVPTDVVINDKYACERFVELCGDDLRQFGGEIWILKDDGRWSKDRNDIIRKVFCFPELIFKQMGPLGIRIFDYYGDTVDVGKLVGCLPIIVPVKTVPFQFDYEFIDLSGASDAMDYVGELLNIISNDNSEVKEYIIKWLSLMLQKPYNLPKVALIFSGAKGCGKDTLFDFLGKWVIGEGYFHNNTKTSAMFQKHDTMRMGRVLVKLEEANRATCLENADALKSMISSEKITFEPKNKGEVTIPNYMRAVMTVNSAIPVDLSQGERRFMISNCSTRRIKDYEFWGKLHTSMMNANAGRVVANWLLSIDLDGFNPLAYPVCSYQEDVIDTVKSTEELFLEDWDGEKKKSCELFEAYRGFCSDNHLAGCMTMTSLGLRLAVLVRDGKLIKWRVSEGTFYRKP